MFRPLKFDQDGAQYFPGSISFADLAILRNVLAHLPSNRAGLRLSGLPGLNGFLAPNGIVGVLAANFLKGGRAVRALLFDKTADKRENVRLATLTFSNRCDYVDGSLVE